ncbi:hypothetical protein [Rathayibacter tanaceti]|uniref:Uncharacterized protein n=2 Tax=Rathayibacter tanaceti TaxID=1671680 RepID=A0A162J3T5_9MICO|nr:hypothetical protein [Rathayibacter tanaceti]KZX21767.1 hypothetical protein ACH61_01071 [Rathayibacter tanaceti]QHC54485.1 hypothetical protein GSU10_01615 [Rathayibacter tanaceti]TCO35024.1 hypothetical protein EV639_10928 [Rathayibacter tanaceti]
MIALLRSSVARFCWPILAAAVVAAFTGVKPVGVWEWSSATQGITSSLAILAPIVVGLAVLDATRWYSADERRRLRQAAIDPMLPVVSHAAAGAAWCLLGYAVGGIVVAALFVAHDGQGSPVWSWLAASASALLLAWSAGHLVGVLARGRWIVAPLAALGTYFGFIPATQLPQGGWRWLSHLYVLTGDQTDVFSGYRESTLLGEMLWYSGAAVVALGVAALVLGQRRRRAVALTVVAAVVAGLGVGGIAQGRGVILEGESGVDLTCASGRVEVCVAAPYAAGLGPLVEAFDALEGRVAGTALDVATVHQGYGGGASTDGEIYLHDLAPGYAERAVRMYVSTRLGALPCRGDSGAVLPLIAQWLAGGDVQRYEHASPGLVAGSARFAGLSEGERIAWFSRHADALLACTVTLADL